MIEKSKNRYTRFRRLLLMKRDCFTYMPCGSFLEMPNHYFSNFVYPKDFDVMFSLKHLMASLEITNISKDKRYNNIVLYIETKDCRIGFARIKKLKQLKSDPSNDTEYDYYRKPRASEYDMLGPRIKKIVDVTAPSKSDILLKLLKGLNEIWEETSWTVDNVYAISCPTWPSVADEWRTRKRENGWPSNDVIDKIVSRGCHLVSKPHQSNPNDDTMWRFSFSQAETILIEHWTLVQKHIYHILRMIKGEVVKACGGEEKTVLCTYFFKTLMLWTLEERPQDFWTEDNIETAVGELICLMIEWLIEKRLLNYFIPDNNMIDYLSNDDDFSFEISFLHEFRTSRLTKLLTLLPKVSDDVSICVDLPLVIAEFFLVLLLRCTHLCTPDNHTLMILLSSKNLLIELRSLFDALTIQRYISTSKCLNPDIYLKMVIKYFKASIRHDGHISTIPIDFSKSPAEIVGQMLNKVNHICDSVSSKSSFNRVTRRFVKPIESRVNRILRNATNYWISVSLFVSTAYYANFLYNVLNDYPSTIEQCLKAFSFFTDRRNEPTRVTHPEFTVPFHVLLTNEWSALFDIHVQAILGFLTLFSAVRTERFSTVGVDISVIPFLDYLYFQSIRNLGMDKMVSFEYHINEPTEWSTYGVFGVCGIDSLSRAILMAAISASGIKPIKIDESLYAYNILPL